VVLLRNAWWVTQKTLNPPYNSAQASAIQTDPIFDLENGVRPYFSTSIAFLPTIFLPFST
jgi:hypothetical protein